MEIFFLFLTYGINKSVIYEAVFKISLSFENPDFSHEILYIKQIYENINYIFDVHLLYNTYFFIGYQSVMNVTLKTLPDT